MKTIIAGQPLPPRAALPPMKGRKGRVTHIIRENSRQFTPSTRFYVDTEAYIEALDTTTQRQTLWFGWVHYEYQEYRRNAAPIYSEWQRFETADECFTFIADRTREKSASYVYAHNLGYDAGLLSLATMAARYEWAITEYVPDPRLLWLTMRKGNRSIIFIDTLNYFQTSLDSLGKAIGEHKTLLTVLPATVETWDEYCRQDVQVLVTAMHHYFALVRELDLGNYRKTAASQAYGAWRHRFMKYPVLILADERVEALERASYHGGRSEVFYDLPLSHDIYGLDVNSMYPWVMRENVYPTRKVAKGTNDTIEGIRQKIAEYLIVANVTVNTQLPIYPYNTGERIIYPTGHFTTVLSTPELSVALAHGHIVAVHEWATYDSAPLFRDYVDTLYALRLKYREDGNDAFSYLCKLLLNSLYGKFGQRGYHWERCNTLDNIGETEFIGNCEADGPILRHRERFGLMWHREINSEAFESFPAIAAHVTANARMALWSLIVAAGRSNVYYCDTDSLYTNAEGYANVQHLEHPSELGKLKLVGVYPQAHFRAPKDYVTGDSVHIKGVRSKAVALAPDEYEQLTFGSYDKTLARGTDGEILVTLTRKRLKRLNHQSVGQGLGWRQPIHLDSDGHHLERLPWEFAPPGKLESSRTHRPQGEELQAL